MLTTRLNRLASRLSSRGRGVRRLPCGAVGFTIVELLVVISLIALLIAILLPVLQNARTAAQMMQSLSQIRQVTLALHNYAGDYNGKLPNTKFDPLRGSPAPDSGVVYSTWAPLLYHQRYLDAPEVFWSPGRDTSWVNFEWIRQTMYHEHWGYPGYVPNDTGAMSWSHGNWPFQGFGPTLNLGKGGNPPPSEHLLLWENFDPGVFPGIDGGGGYGNGNGVAFTYNGGLVRSYVDGHASGQDGSDMGWKATNARNGEWTLSNRYQPPWYDYRWWSWPN